MGELLSERGITVGHVTVYRWVQRFTSLLIDAARVCRHAPGSRWFVDRCDGLPEAGSGGHPRLFTCALVCGPRATEVTTDRAPAYPRVIGELIPAVLRHRAVGEHRRRS